MSCFYAFNVFQFKTKIHYLYQLNFGAVSHVSEDDHDDEAHSPEDDSKVVEESMENMFYAYGLSLSDKIFSQISNNLKDLSIDIEIDSFAQGLNDGLLGKEKFSKEEIKVLLKAFFDVVNEKRLAINDKKIKESSKLNQEFLEKNAAKEGVVTTSSGLQYEIIKQSDKAERASSDSTVHINYTGYLIDGTVFDQGKDAELKLDLVVPGFAEAVSLMTVGSTYKIYIKPELGFGSVDLPNIPMNSLLIFTVELLSVDKKPNAEASEK